MYALMPALIPLAMATFAAATGSGACCSTGPVQCCNSVQRADSPDAAKLLGPLGVVVDGADLVGITCTPVSAGSIGVNSCNSQTVCCNNNNFNGVVVIGCSPININL